MPNTHMPPVKKTVTSADVGTDIELVDVATQAVVNNLTIFSDSDITKTYKVKIGGKQIGVAKDNSMFNDKQHIGVGEALTLELDEVPPRMRTLYINQSGTLRRLLPSITANEDNFTLSYEFDDTFKPTDTFTCTNNSFKAYKNLTDETILIGSNANTIYNYNVDTDTLTTWTDASNIYETIDYNEADGYIYFTKDGGHIFGRILASTMAIDDTWEVTLDVASFAISSGSDMKAEGNILWILPKSTAYNDVSMRITKIDISAETFEYTDRLTGWYNNPNGAIIKDIDGVPHLVTSSNYNGFYEFGEATNLRNHNDGDLSNQVILRNLDNGNFVDIGSSRNEPNSYVQQYANFNRNVLISDDLFFSLQFYTTSNDAYAEVVNLKTKTSSTSKLWDNVSNPPSSAQSFGINGLSNTDLLLYVQLLNLASVDEGIGFAEKFGTTNIRLTGIDVGA